jgi:hypothetical protein
MSLKLWKTFFNKLENQQLPLLTFTRGAGGDHILNHMLHFPNHRVHTKLSDYVSKIRSPSIPLAKGEEEKEKEFNSPPFTRGAGGDQ